MVPGSKVNILLGSGPMIFADDETEKSESAVMEGLEQFKTGEHNTST